MGQGFDMGLGLIFVMIWGVVRGWSGVNFGGWCGIVGLCSRMSWFYLGFYDFGVGF